LREENWAFHLSNLCAGLGAPLPPSHIYSTVLKYFGIHIANLAINILQYQPEDNAWHLLSHIPAEKPVIINPHDFPSLQKASSSDKIETLSSQEIIRLKGEEFPLGQTAALAVHPDKWDYLLFFHPSPHAPDDLLQFQTSLVTLTALAAKSSYLSGSLAREKEKYANVKAELLSTGVKNQKTGASQKAEYLKDILPIIFHKLKNKLTPILGYAQILLAGYKEEAITKRVKKIEKSANELTDHLNLLRDYFEEEKLTFKRINLNDIIRDLHIYFSELQAQKNLKVNLNLDTSIRDDQLLAAHLETLIINLTENAARAIEAKEGASRVISIHTQAMQDGYLLTVEDKGVGINGEEIHKIWDPFFSKFPGCIGIGLSLCNKIIARHEAVCKVVSTEGESTQFQIRFKYKEPEQQQDTAQGAQPVRNKRILLLSNDLAQLELMKDFLTIKPGIQLEKTNTNDHAIELVASCKYDMIISESETPKINGKDFFLFLKRSNIRSKFIMLVPDPMEGELTTFLEQNKIDHITKPIELMKFKRQVIENLN
jgi:signal transduction histidine kinase